MKVLIKKRCHFRPAGSASRVFARPGQVVEVSENDAETMVAGNVADLVEKPGPKRAPKNKAKKVTKTR